MKWFFKWGGSHRNLDEATQRIGPKLKTTHVTLIVDLSPWIWCTTQRSLMRCMYAKYDVIWSDQEEATERTGPKLERTHMTLTFVAKKNGARHIASCVVRMPHMKWFDQIGRTPRSWHNKNFKWPMWTSFQVTLTLDFLTWKWIATHRYVMDYICAKYKADLPYRHGATERPRKKQQLRMTLWPWPSDLRWYVPQTFHKINQYLV